MSECKDTLPSSDIDADLKLADTNIDYVIDKPSELLESGDCKSGNESKVTQSTRSIEVLTKALEQSIDSMSEEHTLNNRTGESSDSGNGSFNENASIKDESTVNSVENNENNSSIDESIVDSSVTEKESTIDSPIDETISVIEDTIITNTTGISDYQQIETISCDKNENNVGAKNCQGVEEDIQERVESAIQNDALNNQELIEEEDSDRILNEQRLLVSKTTEDTPRIEGTNDHSVIDNNVINDNDFNNSNKIIMDQSNKHIACDNARETNEVKCDKSVDAGCENVEEMVKSSTAVHLEHTGDMCNNVESTSSQVSNGSTNTSNDSSSTTSSVLSSPVKIASAVLGLAIASVAPLSSASSYESLQFSDSSSPSLVRKEVSSSENNILNTINNGKMPDDMVNVDLSSPLKQSSIINNSTNDTSSNSTAEEQTDDLLQELNQELNIVNAPCNLDSKVNLPNGTSMISLSDIPEYKDLYSKYTKLQETSSNQVQTIQK